MAKDLKSLFPRASNGFLKANAKVLREIAPDIRAADKTFTPDPPKLPKGRSMSNAELEYACVLDAMRRRGEIESWRYEGVTLKLADGCKFTPDFFVVVSALVLRLRFVEVKGRHIWEDSLIKFRVAKEQNSWAEWELHQKNKAGWNRIL